EVALDTGRTWRGPLGICAGGNAISPIGERFALLSESDEDGAHVRSRGSHHHPMIPGVNAGVERTKALWNFPGRQVAYLVAREALLGLQDHVLIGQISFGDSEEAKPVICRIHLRGRASVRCDNRLE